MKTLLFVLSLALCICLPAIRVEAGPALQQNHSGNELWKPKALQEKLGLSDDQMSKIKTVFASHRESLRKEAVKVRDARANLRNAIQNNAPENDLRSVATVLGNAEGDLAVARASLFAEIKPILTPEQLAKLQTLHTARR